MMTNPERKSNRLKDRWYYNLTPQSQAETLKRFRFLLDLASMSLLEQALNPAQTDILQRLIRGFYQERVWKELENKIEQEIGHIDNDSGSTFATINDNPGTGRIIDKFIFQPSGRSIERLLLCLELRYFRPPEKSARQISRFLEGSAFSGYLIPLDNIWEHSFRKLDENADRSCISLLMEISREEETVKAFQSLLIQASSKQRGLRVEAQKLLWLLLRYKNMVFILNIITNLGRLVWDGYTTFQHCSPLDPEYQTHFYFRWEREFRREEIRLILGTEYGNAGELFRIPIKDILKTCVRENRGFSSLPINLVYDQLKLNLSKDMDKETAESLYLALIAIWGFSEEFPYVLSVLEAQDITFSMTSWSRMHALWAKKERTEADVNTLELLVHFNILLIITNPSVASVVELELERFMYLLNDADKDQHWMSEVEARASEDYLLKVNKRLVQRGPIVFNVFKDIVTSPLNWEKYHRPERQQEARDKAQVSSAWHYKLYISKDVFSNHSMLFYYYTPFSLELQDTIGSGYLDGLLAFINNGDIWEIFEGPKACWFRIQRWLEVLESNSMVLSGDRPGTELHKAMEWWQSYIIRNEREPREPAHRIMKESRHLLSNAENDSLISDSSSSPADFQGQTRTNEQWRPIVGEVGPPATRDTQHGRLSKATASASPCTCAICERPLRVYDEDEDDLKQFGIDLKVMETPTPFKSKSEFLERPTTKVEMEESQLTIEDYKGRTQDRFEISDSTSDSSDTEIKDESTDTGTGDSLTVDEDFWSAKSIAELSMLSID